MAIKQDRNAETRVRSLERVGDRAVIRSVAFFQPSLHLGGAEFAFPQVEMMSDMAGNQAQPVTRSCRKDQTGWR